MSLTITKTHILLVTLLICLTATGQVQARQLTILYTGDTHAALYPCDCPGAPDGGIARRAAAIKQIRDKTPNVLLLDAGGAFAGGVYDKYIRGVKPDKARTRLYLKAMDMMGYDALALGDEELGFGLDFLQSIVAASNIKFLSANTTYKTAAKSIGYPYVIKETDNVRIAVIGLTPQEAAEVLPPHDNESLKIIDPVYSLKQTLTQIKKGQQADLVIVLSHLGEAKSRELLNEFPEINILINGHKKDSLEMLERVGSGLLLQFSYQGRSLGRLDLELDEKNKIIAHKLQSIRMSKEIADDKSMLALLEEFKPAEQPARVAVDLFIMHGCPYCLEAEGVMQQVFAELGDKLDLTVYFVPHDDKTDAQLDQETQVKLLVSRYSPDSFWNYLECRHQDIAGIPWQDCAGKAGADIGRIEQALSSGQGDELLKKNLKHVRQLNILSVPTLFINHKVYTDKIEPLTLIKYICQQLPAKVKACAELPECSSDQDCLKPGMIGSCESAGTKLAKCDFQPAVAVPLTIVRNNKSLIYRAISRPADPLDWLSQLLPGLKTEYVAADSPAGRKLIETYQINRLPAYIFNRAVLKAKNIDQLKEDLILVKDRFILSPSLAQARFYIKRTPKPGQISFLFSPLSLKSNMVLQNVYDIIAYQYPALDFKVHYLVKRNPAGDITAPGGLAELEEVCRQLIIRRDYPGKFKAYVKLRGQAPASSYWEQPLLELGLDPGRIKQKAQSRAADELLAEEAEYLEGLGISSPPMFLINNQELILLQNSRQFKELLNQLQTQEKKRVP